MILKLKVLFCILFAFFIISEGEAQNSFRSYLPDQSGWMRETQVDFSHLLLEIKFEPEKEKVIGKVTHTFKVIRENVDSLYLDGVEMEFFDVILDGIPVPENKSITSYKYAKSKSGITFYFANPLKQGTEHTLEINYTANPKRGIYFIGWNDPTGRCRKQIWTQGEATDNRHWIPMHDDFYDKCITEQIITFPSKYKVLGNGKKISEKKSGTNTIWHYKMLQAHAVYLIMLGIGEYDITTSRSKGGIELIKYMYPDQKDREKFTYANTEIFMDLFEKETGVKYPWGAYSQIPVQDFIYGAMENTSATIFGDFFNCNESMFSTNSYKSVNAHEMAHQWFGDIITCRAGRHMWVNESFATHYQKKVEQQTEGNDYFENNRFKEMQSTLNAGKNDNFPIVHSQAGSTRIYQKGSLVLDMMRNVAGNENYRKSITHYLNKHKFQNTTSYDLLMAFHDACGIDLTWFFEQWIFKGGEPHYKVDFREVNNKYGEFTVQQIHKRDETVGLFKMPIHFQVYYDDNSLDDKLVTIEKETQSIQIENKNGKKIKYILFDPEHTVISHVTFDKSEQYLINQALNAKSYYDRYEAILSLKKIRNENVKSALKSVYKKETSYQIKSDIITYLMEDKNLTADDYSIIESGFSSNDALLKLGISSTFNKYDNPKLVLFMEKLLEDPSVKVVENTLEKLCSKIPNKRGAYLQKTSQYKITDGPIRIVWLKYNILNTYPEGKNIDYANADVKELIDLCSQSFEFRTRKSAIEACRDLLLINDVYLDNITDAMVSRNGRLKSPAIEVFKSLKALEYPKEKIRMYYSQKSLSWKSEKIEELKGYFE